MEFEFPAHPQILYGIFLSWIVRIFIFRWGQTLLFHIVVFENEIILENATAVIPEWLELWIFFVPFLPWCRSISPCSQENFPVSEKQKIDLFFECFLFHYWCGECASFCLPATKFSVFFTKTLVRHKKLFYVFPVSW